MSASMLPPPAPSAPPPLTALKLPPIPQVPAGSPFVPGATLIPEEDWIDDDLDDETILLRRPPPKRGGGS